MKKRLVIFLENLRGDVFKLLPMKESELDGVNAHLNNYLDSLIINIKGAMDMYPQLSGEKPLVYILNNLQYMRNNDLEFKQWRKIVLDATHDIDRIYVSYGGNKDGITDKL